MDTRNYRSEIKQLRQQIAGLHTRKTTLGALCGAIWIGEKLAFRSDRSQTRGKTNEARQALGAKIDQLKAYVRELASMADTVEAREGFLADCVCCNARFRTQFGGELPENADWVMGDDHAFFHQGWLCHQCWPPAIEAFNDILTCYGSFAAISSQSFVPGFRIVADAGWITTDGEFDGVEDVKENLKRIASRRLANACVNFWWERHQDSEVAGYSNNGNPYYRTVVTFSGKAQAVVVRSQFAIRNGSRRRSNRKKSPSRAYSRT